MEKIDYSKVPGNKLLNLNNSNNIKPIIRIITLYSNYNDNFIKTINSVINQTFENWEWIIINNNSLDNNIEEQLNEILNLNINKIKIYKNNNFTNYENIFQKENSNYQYICYLPVESILDKTFLECAYCTLITNSDYDCTYSNYIVYGNEEYTITSLNDEKNIYNNICFITKKEVLSKIDLKNKEFNLIKLLNDGCKAIKMNFYGVWSQKKEVDNNKNLELDSIKELMKNEKQYPYSCNYYYELPKTLEYDKNIIKNNSNKIKLLFIFPWFKMGGADNFNYNLISRLDKEEYDITIITTEDCKYEWRQKFEEHATIFDVTTFLNRENWASFIHYIIQIKNINIVMISNSYYSYYAVPWLKSKFPKVVFLDYLHAVNNDWRNGEYPADSVAISNILDKTYVSSEYIKDYMIKEKNRTNNNIKVLYAGVDTAIFNEEKIELKKYPEILEYKEKYSDKKIILYCCRLSKEKRPMFMLEIFKQMLINNKNVVLFVVGNGELLDEMEKYVNDNNLKDYVVFFGERKEVAPFYKISDILVICSEREGITLTTYEALSMGVPVVTADVGGQYELVSDACGKLIKNNQNYEKELHEYINAINDILYSEKYMDIKENCKKIIKEKFSIDVMVNNFEKEFDFYIQNGSQISTDIINNEQLYAQYLLLYNELDRRYYETQKNDNEVVTQEENLYSEIEKNNKIIEEKQKVIEQIEIEISEKNKSIQEYENKLEKIYTSNSWKFANKISKIADKLRLK